ncbi:hypothetical protein D083_0648 [Dickeya solani RNS 08.23.3.1.A]|nr:hypothetical protein D083_0648 [Dickeya solani RNS 08.23.3.1.A]
MPTLSDGMGGYDASVGCAGSHCQQKSPCFCLIALQLLEILYLINPFYVVMVE